MYLPAPPAKFIFSTANLLNCFTKVFDSGDFNDKKEVTYSQMVLVILLKTENNAILLKKNLKRKSLLRNNKYPSRLSSSNDFVTENRKPDRSKHWTLQKLSAYRMYFFHDLQSNNSFNSLNRILYGTELSTRLRKTDSPKKNLNLYDQYPYSSSIDNNKINLLSRPIQRALPLKQNPDFTPPPPSHSPPSH